MCVCVYVNGVGGVRARAHVRAAQKSAGGRDGAGRRSFSAKCV